MVQSIKKTKPRRLVVRKTMQRPGPYLPFGNQGNCPLHSAFPSPNVCYNSAWVMFLFD